MVSESGPRLAASRVALSVLLVLSPLGLLPGPLPDHGHVYGKRFLKNADYINT